MLHSWCVQSEWDAPTIVGGEGAWVHTADGRSILDMGFTGLFPYRPPSNGKSPVNPMPSRSMRAATC